MNNKTHMSNFYCAMAYPGSPLYKQSIIKGIKLPKTYSGYSQHSFDMLNMSNENLSAAEICEFRDNAWHKFHTDTSYLTLLEKKFGVKARKDVKATARIKLKRKLLNN